MGYWETIGAIAAIILAGIEIYERKRQARIKASIQESADRIESDPVGEFMLRYNRTGGTTKTPTDSPTQP